VLAVTSATLAIVAHAAAGGGLPDTGLTALLTVGLAAIGIVMAGGRRSTASIMAVLGATQLATHVLLSFQAMDMPGAMSYNGVTMIGAHAIAVLVTGCLLARADSAIFAVAAALARLLPTLVAAPPVPAAPALPLPRVAPLRRPTGVLAARANARRGPPTSG
jgi:hypothetical protein